MKKISKILSSVLAASLALSCMAMNVMAASKAHTVTITPDKAEGLKAGDTLTIELAVDNTESLVSFQYDLTFDAVAFTADTTKVSRLEKCIDKPWLDGMKDPDGDWAYYLGNPTYKVGAGKISFAWAGSEGVEADYAIDNRVVGKFYLTVADGVADGEYTFSLTGNSMDAGETLPTDIVCEPITVKVGEDKPDEPELVENPYVFSFDADEETEVKITNSRTGDRTYSLPSFVKGGAKVNALLKITDGADVQANDVFTIEAIKDGTATPITTITVE